MTWPPESRPAKTHHWAKAGKKKHLIELVTQIRACPVPKEFDSQPSDHARRQSHRQKAMRKRKLNFVLLGRPSLRVVRQRQKLGGTQNIERHVIGDGAHRGTRHHELQHKNENHDCGKNAACGGNGDGDEKRCRAEFPRGSRTLRKRSDHSWNLSLGGSYFDPHSQIRRGNILRHAGKQDRHLAKLFQFGAANRASVQVLTNLNALGDRRRACEGVVEIARPVLSVPWCTSWKPLPCGVCTQGTALLTRRIAL